jgi:hypothetical protein
MQLKQRIRVPDHTPVLDAHLLEGTVNFLEFFNTLIERLLGSVQPVTLALKHSK